MRAGLLESPVLLVAGGGTVGAGLRWAVLGALPDGNPGGDATTATLASVSDGLPWGLPWPVMLVNLVGCALLGALLGRGMDSRVRLLVGAGFCGGLTTFSTFSLDNFLLMHHHRGHFALNFFGSLVGGWGMVLIGLLVAQEIF